MDAIPLWVLILALLVCLLMSAFFSGSETSMMSLNRYRLKHLVEEGQPSAKRTAQLLKRPDRLLGTILLGNNFVNILATSLGTIIGIRLYGDFGVLLAHYLVRGDRLTLTKMAGCVVGFLGVLAVNFNPQLLDFRFSLMGDGAVLFAAFLMASGMVYGKHVSQTLDSAIMTGYQLLIGGAVLLLVGFALGGHLAAPTQCAFWVMAFLVVEIHTRPLVGFPLVERIVEGVDVVAVPFFFMASAFLCFRGLDESSFADASLPGAARVRKTTGKLLRL